MKEIVINLAAQSLQLFENNDLLRHYSVSTAANGAGERVNSFQTPRGRHTIHTKIGANMPINTVFRGRQPTGEIYSPQLTNQQPDRDWILTRILWLAGCEPNKNQGGDVDTLSRHIYIHGTPDSTTLGIPSSHGCVRMANLEIVELFDLVETSVSVNIVEAE
ncbi:L,D-transpeptidase [Candidatus Persebacteraceae bacterium Df01]|jgi:lipoprotein-anchoring transpeptidase ErfK/SrfK|uniref:L,D-transpeptidase n=1 Tax=Candidatus Doriopsillibacter californiensis TaxID=2970740 RepID=A0ABT7QKV9_9GAMM|nr:L,D-transpeptidase [Candidatus Persebacteraceae bacterium Df01]